MDENWNGKLVASYGQEKVELLGGGEKKPFSYNYKILRLLKSVAALSSVKPVGMYKYQTTRSLARDHVSLLRLGSDDLKSVGSVLIRNDPVL